MPRDSRITQRLPVLSGFPGSPMNGQSVITALASPANEAGLPAHNVLQEFRYRGDGTAPVYQSVVMPWERIGGSDVVVARDSLISAYTTGASAYAYGSALTGLTFTLPWRGLWDIEWDIWGFMAGAAYADVRCTPFVGGYVTQVTGEGFGQNQNWGVTFKGSVRSFCGLANSVVDIRLSASAASVQLNLYTRSMRIRPVLIAP